MMLLLLSAAEVADTTQGEVIGQGEEQKEVELREPVTEQHHH